MNKNLVAAILVALAPLSVIAQAQPKMASKPAMSGGKMSGSKMMGSHKMMGGKKKTSKKMKKKMMGGKMTHKRMMPPRDPKTGRFMKKGTTAPMAKTGKM